MQLIDVKFERMFSWIENLPSLTREREIYNYRSLNNANCYDAARMDRLTLLRIHIYSLLHSTTYIISSTIILA